jgi:predicted permease
MSWLNIFLARLRSLLGRDAVIQDIDEELRLHIELETQTNIERGMSPEAARQAARRSFGNIGYIKDVAYEIRGGGLMETILQDIRYAMRTLRKSPGFALVAILALALGIGANTAIFSIVNAVLLRPLKYPHPEQLVLVQDVQPPPANETPADYAEYLDWRDQSSVFAQLAAYFGASYTLTGQGEPQQLWGARVSANLLPTLGINPILGRSFQPEEEARQGERVALISYGFWQRQFAGDPKAVGQTITLNAQPYTIIGVLPSTVRAVNPQDIQTGRERDVWIPLRLDAENAPRGLHFLTVLGRLRPGVNLAQASEAMQTLSANLQQARAINHSAQLIPLQRAIVPGDTRTELLLLLGAVGFVLLVACANVANLMLTRASARQKEIAIRLAMGASRLRLIRQLLTESLLLALLSGSLGLLLSLWSVSVFVATARTLLPRMDEVGLDIRVLAFTLLLSLVTGLVFGLAPALRASTTDLHETLKEGGGRTGPSARQQRLRGLLIIAEVALSLMLLVGAGLLLRSFVQVLTVDKGFDAEQLLTASISLSPTKYDKPEPQGLFFQQFLARVKSVPGVEGAAIISDLPLATDSVNGGVGIVGHTYPPHELPNAEKSIISPDYFSVMRTAMVRGRAFNEQDNAGAAPVAIINESFARRYFANEDPIGKQINFNWNMTGAQQIVGIVRDVKQYGLDTPTAPTVYVCYLQRPESGMTVVVRSQATPASLVAVLRQQLRAVDREQPLTQVRTMQEIVSESVAARRVLVMVFALFAVVALVLAAIGIYGVIAYSVAQRTHEFGIRMALGAQARDVLKLVIWHGLRLTLVGVALGLGGALLLTRVLASLLFGISATDPITFTGVALLLTFVALIACYVPARRATKIDPLIALKYE